MKMDTGLFLGSGAQDDEERKRREIERQERNDERERQKELEGIKIQVSVEWITTLNPLTGDRLYVGILFSITYMGKPIFMYFKAIYMYFQGDISKQFQTHIRVFQGMQPTRQFPFFASDNIDRAGQIFQIPTLSVI